MRAWWLALALVACGGGSDEPEPDPPAPATSSAELVDGTWQVTIRDGTGASVGFCTIPEVNTVGVTDAAGAIEACRTRLGL